MSYLHPRYTQISHWNECYLIKIRSRISFAIIFVIWIETTLWLVIRCHVDELDMIFTRNCTNRTLHMHECDILAEPSKKYHSCSRSHEFCIYFQMISILANPVQIQLYFMVVNCSSKVTRFIYVYMCNLVYLPIKV